MSGLRVSVVRVCVAGQTLNQHKTCQWQPTTQTLAHRTGSTRPDSPLGLVHIQQNLPRWQWRIRHFPGGGGGRQLPKPKTAWKWKHLDPGGRASWCPLRSATGWCLWCLPSIGLVLSLLLVFILQLKWANLKSSTRNMTTHRTRVDSPPQCVRCFLTSAWPLRQELSFPFSRFPSGVS